MKKSKKKSAPQRAKAKPAVARKKPKSRTTKAVLSAVATASAPKRRIGVRDKPAKPAARPKPVALHAVPRASRKATEGAHPNAKSSVRIFQIYYEDWHEQLLDPEFVPYDNRGVQSELFEFEVFEKLIHSAQTKGAQYWGALSWRFGEKTGMSGKELLATIEANPGFDVYYCNPFPANEAVYHNGWVQGEPSHPSFLALSKAFFEAAGLQTDRLSLIQVSGSFSASNYMVGSPAFWDAFVLFVRRALGNAQRKMPANMRALLHSKVADQHNFHFGATYVPFIVERLLGTFLATDGAGLKSHKFPLPAREAELNVHQRLLREMKDVAHKTRSNWLAAIWMNYRALYLTQTNGREWCQKYLRSITPAEIRFG